MELYILSYIIGLALGYQLGYQLTILCFYLSKKTYFNGYKEGLDNAIKILKLKNQ